MKTYNIIDAHCHLPKDGNLNDLITTMDQNNIEKTVLILNTTKEKEFFINQIDIALENKHRLGILIALDPFEKNYLDYFNKIKKYGFNYGVKLHSRFHNITINDIPRTIGCLNQIDFTTIMIDHFLYGPQIETFIGLELALAVSREFPNKKVIIAHSGGIELLKTMLSTRIVKNIYYDLSLTIPYLFNTSIYKDIQHFIRLTHNRIMYGSDHPDFTQEYSIKQFYTLMKDMDLSEEYIENIMINNALEIYKDIFN